MTFLILAAVEITIAKTKPDALFFAVSVLGIGLSLRAYSHKLSGLKTVTMTKEVAEMVAPDLPTTMQSRLEEGKKIMVAARGINPVLNFALEEAQLRKAVLCVVYIKEVAVYFADVPRVLGSAKWQDDPQARAIMSLMLKEGEARGVCVQPIFAVSEDPSATIMDLAATLGVDYIILGASQRRTLADLLKGSVATQIAQNLPDSIRLVIFG